MKILKKLLLVALYLCLCFSCSEKEEMNSFASEETTFLKSATIMSVSPSGDITGVTDANNIENALNQVKVSGGTVYLTDGDGNTVDNYYSSRNIVSDGFNGTLKGESQTKTIINAGRMSKANGFQSTTSPWWSQIPDYSDSNFPTVFQLDNATGDVTIADLTILVNDDQPANPQLGSYRTGSTNIETYIEILGGEHNTTIKNVRLEGKASVAPGNINGMNVAAGIHVMLGSPLTMGKGNLTVQNVEVENTGGDALLFMRFQDGSEITVDKVIAKNVNRGIYAGGVFGSSVKISNMDITVHALGKQGIGVWAMPSGLQIMHNTIRESKFYGIALWPGIENATVYKNKFIDIENKAGVLVMGNGNSIYSNDYKKSGIVGWTPNAPNGPGAVLLTPGTNANWIHEMKFPPGTSKTLCEMILDLTDDPLTKEYDGLNEIHNYQPCENLASRDAKFDEMEIEPPGLFKMY